MKIRKHIGKLVGMSLLGLVLLGNFTKKYEVVNETYQGWIRNGGDIEYVFDEKDKYHRYNGPKYSLIGNPSLRNSLEIGETYSITIEKANLPWASKEINSVKKDLNKSEGEK